MKATFVFRVFIDIGRLGRALGRLFMTTNGEAPQACGIAPEARCSLSQTFSISPGGVYELRFLILVEGPAEFRVVPIDGQLSFIDADGDRVPPEFDVHAYQAGDLSAFVVEGFSATLAQYEIHNLLVAHRYFIAPPHALEVRLELAAPMPFRVTLLECEPLVANWISQSKQMHDVLEQHHRRRLETLPPILRQRHREWSRTDCTELKRIAATGFEQIGIVTRLWEFRFKWSAACAQNRIEQLADAYYRSTGGGDTDKRPAIAFIGGERLYSKLLAHFTVVLASEHQGVGLLDDVALKALVIESVTEDLNSDWCQVWCNVDEGRIAPAGRQLLKAAQERDLPVVFYYTAASDDTWLFRGLLEQADHVFVEGEPDTYADARLLGAESRTEFVPRSFERLLARPLRDDVSDGYGILFPCCSDLFQYPEVRGAIDGLPPAATIIVELSYDFYLRSARLLNLSKYLFCRIFSYHEALRMLRHAGVVVLAERTLLSPVRQQDIVLDAIASGAVVVFIGDPSRLGALASHVTPVRDATELSEQVRLLANEFYREQRWIAGYRRICRSHSFDAVSRRLRAVVLGEAVSSELPRASMILVTKRPHLLARCIERFHAQSYPNKELVIILNEEGAHLPEAAASGENICAFSVGREYNIGFCLNAAIAVSSGRFWFKVDDDDYYDRYYLEDMINTFLYSDSDAVGKWPTIFYLEAIDTTVVRVNGLSRRRRSVQPRQYLCGATLSGRSDRDLPRFSQTVRNGNDSHWIEQLRARQRKLVFSSPTGFAIHRSSDKSGHTHLISDDQVLEQGHQVLWPGQVVRGATSPLRENEKLAQALEAGGSSVEKGIAHGGRAD